MCECVCVYVCVCVCVCMCVRARVQLYKCVLVYVPVRAQIYHHSVGSNSVLELDVAIDRTGRVDPVHAAAYKQFGDWIRTCYGTPLASTAANGTQVLTLALPDNTIMDRVWIRESLVRELYAACL
ncbi:MAG: hypothetical protein P4L40_24555 [Terracidiphilus sp.]|nr:hypothetical protein [Terracidiphilus sp.]